MSSRMPIQTAHDSGLSWAELNFGCGHIYIYIYIYIFVFLTQPLHQFLSLPVLQMVLWISPDWHFWVVSLLHWSVWNYSFMKGSWHGFWSFSSDDSDSDSNDNDNDSNSKPWTLNPIYVYVCVYIYIYIYLSILLLLSLLLIYIYIYI